MNYVDIHSRPRVSKMSGNFIRKIKIPDLTLKLNWAPPGTQRALIVPSKWTQFVWLTTDMARVCITWAFDIEQLDR